MVYPTRELNNAEMAGRAAAGFFRLEDPRNAKLASRIRGGILRNLIWRNREAYGYSWRRPGRARALPW